MMKQEMDLMDIFLFPIQRPVFLLLMGICKNSTKFAWDGARFRLSYSGARTS